MRSPQFPCPHSCPPIAARCQLAAGSRSENMVSSWRCRLHTPAAGNDRTASTPVVCLSRSTLAWPPTTGATALSDSEAMLLKLLSLHDGALRWLSSYRHLVFRLLMLAKKLAKHWSSEAKLSLESVAATEHILGHGSLCWTVSALILLTKSTTPDHQYAPAYAPISFRSSVCSWN